MRKTFIFEFYDVTRHWGFACSDLLNGLCSAADESFSILKVTEISEGKVSCKIFSKADIEDFMN